MPLSRMNEREDEGETPMAQHLASRLLLPPRPLPYPSLRNNIIWLRWNPWFERELLPLLQPELQRFLGRVSN